MTTGKLFPGWWQIGIALLVQAVSVGVLFSSYSVVAVSIGEVFSPSRMVLMLGITAMAIVSGAVSPWLGASIDKYPLRALLLAGAGFLSIGFLCLSYVTAMWQVILIYALFMSVASVLLGPVAASALLSRWFVRRRGMAMGIAAMGSSIGGLFFPPIVQWLIDGLEWRGAFQALGLILALITVPAILALLINRPSDRGLNPDGDVSAPEPEGHSQGTAFGNARAIVRSADFWIVSLTIGTIFSAGAAVVSNMVPFALDIGASRERGAFMISAVAAASLTGKMVFATVADRLNLRYALVGSVLTIILALSCFIIAESYVLILAGSTIFGLASGSILPLWGLLLSRLFGAENIGRAMGMMNFVIMPLNLLSPPLFGLVHDLSGSYDYAFVIYTVLLAVVLLLLPKMNICPNKNSASMPAQQH